MYHRLDHVRGVINDSLLIVLLSIFVLPLKVGAQTSADQTQTISTVNPTHASLSQNAPQNDDRYALFWSGGNTWIVDTKLGVLFRSPTLIAQGTNGFLLEYRLEVHNERLPSERPFGDLYRWVSLDRYIFRGQHVDQLTNHFAPQELKTETHDEHQILQFTGEYITLIRWFYHETSEARPTEGTSIYSLALDGVEPLPQMTNAGKLFSFTKSLYPELIPSCVTPETRLVHWELSGQRSVYWLTLTPDHSLIDCEIGLSALRVNPPRAIAESGDLAWRDETLFYRGESLYGGVVDALLHSSGRVAITLEGPSRRDDRLLVPQIPLIYEKPTRRYLSFWRAYDEGSQGEGRHFSFSDELEIHRLDGARWIKDDHPLIALLDTHFMPIHQPSCFRSLELKRLDRYRRPERGKNFGHLCAIQTTGRVWEGHKDLSASVQAQVIDQTLYLDLWVNDPDRHPHDQVKLWVGSSTQPVEITLTPKGVIGKEAIQAGVKLNWWERNAKRGSRKRLDSPHELNVGGYQIHLQVPVELTQGSLSLSIEDVDFSLPSAHQKLWLIGRPPSPLIESEISVIPERFILP